MQKQTAVIVYLKHKQLGLLPPFAFARQYKCIIYL